MFSGIGGFEKGIINAIGDKAEFVGFSEVDKYAISIYKKHYPKHKEYGDARRIIPEEIPDFDLLVGGFPCQSFSIAGKRGGFKDTRGTLFYEIARIASVKRPKLLLLENVKGLLSHDKGRTFGTILATLSDLGYVLEWQVLNSKNFGVPQNRERVFIIGHLGGIGGQTIFPIGESNSKTLEQIISGGQGNRVYDTKGTSTTIASQAGGQGAKTGLYAIDFRNKRKHEISPTLLGNAHNTHPFITGGLQAHASTMKNCSTALTEAMGKGGGHTPILNSIRRLTPTECERLQGFPDNFTDYGIDNNGKQVKISDSQRYKCLGNAVTTNVITAIMNKLLDKPN